MYEAAAAAAVGGCYIYLGSDFKLVSKERSAAAAADASLEIVLALTFAIYMVLNISITSSITPSQQRVLNFRE